MGLFQAALETYDTFEDKVGVYESNKSEPLAPVGHLIAKADIEITIDMDGKFIQAAIVPKDQAKVIIPVTEESAGRSSNIAPHPLCEQIQYLCSYDSKSSEKREKYLSQLRNWIDSGYGNPKISAIYSYVDGDTLLEDLVKSGIITRKEQKPDKPKLMVVWNVLGDGNESRVTHDRNLMKNYADYYQALMNNGRTKICMISGKDTVPAEQHLKGVFSFNGNAKLISANDKTNFTYRGRFRTSDEALTIGYEASQKAHNALKWIVSNYGKTYGGRAFVCWSPEGDSVPDPSEALLDSLWNEEEEEIKEPEFKDYSRALGRKLMGFHANLNSIQGSETVTACFDAATSGRLAVTFFSEIRTEDYLQRLYDWDYSCCWFNKDSTSILSPSLPVISKYAFGTERDRTHAGKIEVDDKINKQTIERLLRCRIGKEKIPFDIERRLVENASRMNLYGKDTRRTLLATACAVVKKYHYDYQKEDLTMTLEEDRKDRSYQFGRLLAVYEKIERDTFDVDEKREPNAIQLQSVYCNRPLHYAFELDKQMERAYFAKLSPGTRIYYKNLIGNIMEIIGTFPEKEWDKPLSDTYLIGYYLQRKSLYTKRNKKNENEELEESGK